MCRAIATKGKVRSQQTDSGCAACVSFWRLIAIVAMPRFRPESVNQPTLARCGREDCSRPEKGIGILITMLLDYGLPQAPGLEIGVCPGASSAVCTMTSLEIGSTQTYCPL
jgi:hypothetical protein